MLEPTSLAAQIVFENSDLLIVDKPWGWLSVPSRIGRKDPRHCLGILLQEQRGEQIWPCNRLDVEVSGLIVFARNAKTHRTVNHMFEHRLVTKTYQALSTFPLDLSDPQIPNPEPQVWNSQLVRGKKRTFEAKHGQPAATFAQCLGPITLKPKTDNLPAMLALEWLLKPQSGLPHQLRFEMKKHGVPILGDGLYGGPSLFKSPHMIALRCTKLEFANGNTNRAHLIPEQIEAALNLHSQIEGELL